MSVPTINLEVMLANWSESHSNGAKVTFWLADPADLDVFRTLTVRKGNRAGQRFMAVFALLGDGETPEPIPGVHVPDQAAAGQPAGKPPAAPAVPADRGKGGRLARLASQLCRNPAWRRWAQDKHCVQLPDEAAARALVLQLCGIESRAELDHNQAAANLFHAELRRPFADLQEGDR
ncbi:hypothetical protein MW290_25575 [Aquincola tertiaricarbonis]|uniref:Uncharacterized protein n=1 Tax=Aquincola tertiaricarbonis TaxID=391953 RepID=A0ABY4SA45_AQUTE|nr:hypothetical protein [Aquincola tertiaricarbonis]URI08942.1 hypothetical protein MW290_25575 [Aquincola tertiaricarbonis]